MSDKHTKHGKWSEAGVPHKDWKCVGIEDLGAGVTELCGMCESVEIRYSHHMKHRDYHEILSVGCVCAENMEQDTIGPRKRETELRSRVKRKQTWDNMIWHISAAGNSYVNKEGYLIVLSEKTAGWSVFIKNKKTHAEAPFSKRFDSEEDAKEAAFSYFQKIKGHDVC